MEKFVCKHAIMHQNHLLDRFPSLTAPTGATYISILMLQSPLCPSKSFGDSLRRSKEEILLDAWIFNSGHSIAMQCNAMQRRD